MESTGFIRGMRPNGTITIPMKVVRELNLPLKSKIFIYFDFEDDLIIIKKYEEKDKIPFIRPIWIEGRMLIPTDIRQRLNLDIKNKVNYFELFTEEENLILKLIED